MKKNMNRSVLRLAACILAVAVLTTAVGAFGAVRDTSKNADGSAAASNSSALMRRIYSAFIHVSLATSNIAGDLLMPDTSNASTSSSRVKNSLSSPGFQPSSAT